MRNTFHTSNESAPHLSSSVFLAGLLVLCGSSLHVSILGCGCLAMCSSKDQPERPLHLTLDRQPTGPAARAAGGRSGLVVVKIYLAGFFPYFTTASRVSCRFVVLMSFFMSFSKRYPRFTKLLCHSLNYFLPLFSLLGKRNHCLIL
jgi:hypothetical protein